MGLNVYLLKHTGVTNVTGKSLDSKLPPDFLVASLKHFSGLGAGSLALDSNSKRCLPWTIEE